MSAKMKLELSFGNHSTTTSAWVRFPSYLSGQGEKGRTGLLSYISVRWSRMGLFLCLSRMLTPYPEASCCVVQWEEAGHGNLVLAH